MHKIKRFSLFLRVIFQIAFVVWPTILAAYWATAPHSLSNSLSMINFIPHGVEILHPLTRNDIILGFVIGILPISINMIITYFLIKLFKLYEQGKIFTLSNVKYIRNIGITMLLGQLVSFIYDGLMSFTLTIHNPPGHKYALVTFGTYDTYNIITALMVIIISWIMAEGYKLQEEQKYTV